MPYFTRAAIVSTCLLAFVAFANGQAPKPDAKPSFKPDQKVEVREGDEWSPAMVIKQEGRKFQIRYPDGTEEWVTSERLRVPGAAGAPAPAAAPATKTGDKPAAPAPAQKVQKDVFAVGAKVEVKSTATWKPATIKNRDGDLYLIIYTERPDQFWWEWVHSGIIRKVGSAKDWHDWGRGVKVSNQGVAKAKEEAKREFANLDQEMAAAARGEKKDPFAPIAYDKPLTDIVLDKIDDIVPVGGPAKLATFDPEPAPPAKLAERAYVFKGTGGRWHNGPAALFIAGTHAVAAYTSDGMGADARTTSLETIDLANGQNLGLVDADALSMPADLSPSGDRLVGIQHGFHSGTKIRVDVHTLKPGAKPQHLISFVPYPSEFWKDVDSARFVGGSDHVLTSNRGGTLILWNAPKATAVWRIKSDHAATTAISPGGKQIAVVNEGALVVLDALSGKVLCRIPGNRSIGSLTFTPDGKRVVGLSTWSVACWDLEQGKVLPDIGLPVKGAGSGLTALDGRFVLIGGTDVLDLDKKVVVWRYNSSARGGRSGAAPQVHDGRCWTVIVDDKRPVLTAAKLPHEPARKAADSLAVGQGLLLTPGGRVSLSVAIEAPGDQQQRITDAITAQLKQSGITVDPNSPIKLNARTEQGKTTEQTYEVREFGRPFNRNTETVSVTEKITRVFVEIDGKVAWESRTSSGAAPLIVQTKEGQTINDAVQAGSKFNVAFLESVRVPAYVPRPSDTPWLGESTWGMSGVSNDQAIAQPNAPAAAGVPAAAPAQDGL